LPEKKVLLLHRMRVLFLRHQQSQLDHQVPVSACSKRWAALCGRTAAVATLHWRKSASAILKTFHCAGGHAWRPVSCNNTDARAKRAGGFAGNERWRTLSAPREFGQPVDSPPFGEYSRVAGADLPGFIARQRSIRRAACDQNLHGLRLRWAGPIAGHVARTVPGAYVKVTSYVRFPRQAPLCAH